MTIRLPSASALPRAFACIESFALPQSEEESSVHAIKGSYVHAFMRRIGKEGPDAREAALAEIPEDDEAYELCADVEVDKVPRGGHHELSLAWNPESGEGRMLGEDLDRAYEQAGADRATEFVGSEDFGGMLQDSRGLVLDYKSGWQLQRAKESWQMRGLSVMHAAASGADEIVGAHVIMRGDRPRWDWFEFDAMALAGFREEMRDLAARLRALPPRDNLDTAHVVEGPHCRYCPAFNRCPAKVGLVREMARALDNAVSLNIVDRDHAARVYVTLKRYDGMAKRLREQISKMAELSPIDLGDGNELRMAPGEPKDKVVDPQAALAYVATRFDAEAATEAATTNKTALVKAAKSFARREHTMSSNDAAEKIIAELRDRELIKKVQSAPKVREVEKEIE